MTEAAFFLRVAAYLDAPFAADNYQEAADLIANARGVLSFNNEHAVGVLLAACARVANYWDYDRKAVTYQQAQRIQQRFESPVRRLARALVEEPSDVDVAAAEVSHALNAPGPDLYQT